MVDSQDRDLKSVFVDAIQHPVRASPSAPQTRELVAQLASDPLWLVEQHSGDECDHLHRAVRPGGHGWGYRHFLLRES